MFGGEDKQLLLVYPVPVALLVPVLLIYGRWLRVLGACSRPRHVELRTPAELMEAI